jgi:hypothetical protein
VAVVIVVVAAPFFLVGLGDGIMPQPVNVRMKLETSGFSRGWCPRVGRHRWLSLGYMETEGNAVRGKKEEKDDQNRNEPTLEKLLMHAITLRYGVGQTFQERAESTGSQGVMSRKIKDNDNGKR